MRLATALLLTSAWIVPAAAQDATHIRQVPYAATKRTDLIGVVGQPTTITFPKGEGVYRVVQTEAPDPAGVDNAPWHSSPPDKETPFGNNLPLWPAIPGVSMMTVITLTAEGVQRVYPFRLLARPAEAGAADAADVTLNLIFTGTAAATPDPVQAAAWRARQQARKTAQETADAEEHLRTDAFNGAEDACHYTAKGKRSNAITPRCPMDNGEWTLFRFPGLSRKPAVYVVTGKDDERLARQHGAGDFVVVEEIAAHFRLRLGDDVLDIINQAYDPIGRPAGTGTTSPTVVRDVIQAKSR